MGGDRGRRGASLCAVSRRAPARQLLGQSPDARADLARQDRPALHPRPGRDPDLPGTQAVRPRDAAAQDRRGARQPAADRERRRCEPAHRHGDASPSRAVRAACRPRASSCRSSTAGRARQVEVRDLTFLGRVGWTDIVAERGRGTAVRTSVSSADPTNRLRTYRGITLQDVTDQRVGRFTCRPGRARSPARACRASVADTRRRRPPTRRIDRRGRSRRAVRGCRAPAQGVFVLMLLAAFGWGALHALSPGTARQWSPPTSSVRAVHRDTRSRSEGS